MKFAHPWLMSLLWIMPGLLLFFYYAGKSRKKRLALFGELDLLKRSAFDLGDRRFRMRAVLLWCSVLLLIIAALGPCIGHRLRPVGRGADIIIALDVSTSMLAQDMATNRLERAKLAICDLVLQLEGDRVGLVVFAGTAFVQAPLTRDYDALLTLLERVDVDLIPVGGTNIQSAIERAVDAFKFSSGSQQVLIIVSDGENHLGDPIAVAKGAASQGVRVFTLGIGTSEGELIPITDEQGGTTYLKDNVGRIVRTRLDEQVLQEVAKAGGGAYRHAVRGDFGLDQIYHEVVAADDGEISESSEPINRFQVPLFLAVLLLGIEIMVERGRRLV
ncbi:MAG: VWA domain-containing protein [Limnochordia bacterium]|nr:VWA domain-containing protein [Limnochordia bacterium]